MLGGRRAAILLEAARLGQGIEATMTQAVQAVIPAYNCGTTIAAVVDGVRALDLPVLVVDDGSTDQTAEAARAAGAACLQHPGNRGKGHALVSGFRWALAQGAEAVLTLDGDGQHSPADVFPFLERAKSAELLIGRRVRSLHTMPISSFIGNSVSVFWVSLFSGHLLPDPQCGMRLYGRRLLEAIPLRGGRFETETEILLRASRLGMRIGWVPIQTIYQPPAGGRRRTHYRNTRDSLRVIATVISSAAYPRRPR
jgi:glycosyltransferase involved in cell wall biosynthesis